MVIPSAQFTNQALFDQVQFNFTGFLGAKVEFRIIVLDAGGTIILAGPPAS